MRGGGVGGGGGGGVGGMQEWEQRSDVDLIVGCARLRTAVWCGSDSGVCKTENSSLEWI